MDSYAQSEYYGSETLPTLPYLCMGVAFTSSGNNKYEYNIRFNTSTNKGEVYNTIDLVEQTVSFVK